MAQCKQHGPYNEALHSSCPFCSVIDDVNVGPTKAASVAGGSNPTKPGSAVNRPKAGSNDSPLTVGVFDRRTGVDPVVGWIVCVKGPNLGRDYRLHSDYNKIGRDPSMDVCIEGDPTISRDIHCQIVYSSRNRRFNIVPGTGRNLVYLNGNEVLAAAVLNSLDEIEIGDSTFRFQSFCSDKFDWSSVEKAKPTAAAPKPTPTPTPSEGDNPSGIG